MKWPGRVRDALHAERRVAILARHLAPLLPRDATVLDVGCGDGMLAAEILALRNDVSIQGVEVIVRSGGLIEVREFDGRDLPFEPRAFDVALAADVLHHAEDPAHLLGEMVRVAGDCVVLKDHTRDGWLAGPTLRFMDWVGNAHVGVALPYNYWTRAQWDEAWQRLGLQVEALEQRIDLYPPPARWLFDRSLHFVARLRQGNAPAASHPAGPGTSL